ncbi:MAG TPA: hypothetical protein VHE55_19265 [Fimbriimonadaceae bacterium]|nr:hypothetical protein [Fimbriimonadaceae bacterium]
MKENCGNVKKRAIWTAAGIAAAAATYFLVIRPRHLHWGATKKEAEGYLPGDAFIEEPDVVATHAITIDAPVLDVWPWIAQLGQGRGGFYSYTMLENLVGCDMHNATEIHPEWQEVQQGDVIRFHPKFPPSPIEMLDTGNHMVVGIDLKSPNQATWAFVLKDLGNNKTRFIVRLRARTHKGLGRLGDLLVTEPAHFIMERKMMLTIKHLAESRFATRPEVAA